MSGSKLRVSNPLSTTGVTFPWSRDRRLWLSSQTLFFEQRVREDLWLSATCATFVQRRATVSRVKVLGRLSVPRQGSFDTPPFRPLEQHGAPVSNESAREPKINQ